MGYRFTDTIRRVIRSERFFYGVVALLVLQAAWIALSGRYPMAYDEQNHLGIVKLYAEHPSPFWAEQPPGPAPYSAVERDPSYLYHWLMSLPYHLFDAVLPNDDAVVLAYRFISIGLFAGGLVLYRRVLLRTAAPRALVHAVLAVFVLVPTVPYLAGQMNYDNLLFLLVPAVLLLAMRFMDSLRAGRPQAAVLLWLAAAGMLASLVKFPFLALLLPLLAWIAVVAWKQYGRQVWRRLPAGLLASYRALPRAAALGLTLLVLAAGVLFAERYGGNIVRYGTPTPECDQVLDVERCKAFGPWKRNYDIYQAKLEGRLDPVRTNPLSFFWDNWLRVMVWQFFYTLNGPADGFSIGFPLPWPYYTGRTLALAGVVVALIFYRYVWRRPSMRGLLLVAVFYCFVLWAQNYADFLRLNVATAIQARYIVLVLPVLLLALALAVNRALRALPAAKAGLVLAVLVIFATQGGGIGVYIVRSDQSWWWQSGRVVQANQAAQRLLGPVVMGEDKLPVPVRPEE